MSLHHDIVSPVALCAHIVNVASVSIETVPTAQQKDLCTRSVHEFSDGPCQFRKERSVVNQNVAYLWRNLVPLKSRWKSTCTREGGCTKALLKSDRRKTTAEKRQISQQGWFVPLPMNA